MSRSGEPGRLLRRQRGRTEMRLLTLSFTDASADREFRCADNESALNQVRVAGILAVLLYGAFGALDPLVVDGDVSDLALIRFAIVCPAIALIVASSFPFRSFFVSVLQLAVCFVVVLAAFGLAAMPLIAAVPREYSQTGTLLILMFLFGLVRVRFLWATATTLVVVAGYETSAILQDLPWQTLLYNNFFLLGFIVVGLFTAYTLESLRRRGFLREHVLADERERSEGLLRNILPDEIATRLKENPSTIADAAPDVSVVFADIVNFTQLAESMEPDALVRLLDAMFSDLDDLCDELGAEKIKTIGDAYMAVAGLPIPDPDHAATAMELALGMQHAATRLAPKWPVPLQLRIGISSGPVVAGVIGRRKFAYDLWGDTVNTASRMESHGYPGEIHVSASTKALLDGRYQFGPPVQTAVKGKGTLTTYLLARDDAVAQQD